MGSKLLLKNISETLQLTLVNENDAKEKKEENKEWKKMENILTKIKKKNLM